MHFNCNNLNKLVLLLALFLTNPAAAQISSCYPGDQITYKFKNKDITLKREFCVEGSKAFLVNKECHKKLDCEAMKPHEISHDVLKAKSPVGSPGHRVCSVLKGTPMIIRYKTTGDWADTSICIFGDDSFVSLPYLQRYLIVEK